MLQVKSGRLAVESGVDNALAYFLSPGGSWFWLMAGLSLTASLLAFYANSPPLLYVRYVFGAFFVLFLPGYALVEALYPRGGDLSPLERLALSIGLSLAVVPLVGLVLNFTPFGIRLAPVVISLAALTTALSLYATYRRFKAEASEQYAGRDRPLFNSHWCGRYCPGVFTAEFNSPSCRWPFNYSCGLVDVGGASREGAGVN
ncbi:hypothetical protein CGL51_10410 [Pyrobaculum aerophilum]|uniref:DUF1616 domain-containing protein n=1 Tax=Pyrobaculum aerophilum TaxID=13773 RepID=A0A371QVT8_9CREN|nr:hypothetical protein CGL51_10410 [Pyrobaculum aerophilum]